MGLQVDPKELKKKKKAILFRGKYTQGSSFCLFAHGTVPAENQGQPRESDSEYGFDPKCGGQGYRSNAVNRLRLQ